MKKNTKKLLTGTLISLVTLGAGFLITLISFNLFDTLNANQMKILFAIDVVCLIASGAGAYLHFESKRAKKMKESEFQKRHFQRMSRQCREYKGIEKYLNISDTAA